MQTWQYCRVYAVGVAKFSANSQLEKIEIHVWVHSFSNDALHKFAYDEVTYQQGIYPEAGQRASNFTYKAIADLGADGWELVSIDFRNTFLQTDRFTVATPAFYLKRPIDTQ